MRRKILFLASILLFLVSIAILIEQNPVGKATLPVYSIEEGVSSGTQMSEPTTYVYGNKLIAKKGQDLTYFLQDSLGSNRLIVDDMGRLKNHYINYPYGKTVLSKRFSDPSQRFTFTGKEDDGHLMYFGARYLDPRTGRFTSIDPLLSSEADYDYAMNNPLKMVDPDGNKAEPGEGVLRSYNVGISAAFSLISGVIRGDSWQTIAKNTAIGAVAGLGSFEAKRYVGQTADSDLEFLGAHLASNFFNSVRTNSMRNQGAFSNLQFDYLPMTLSYSDKKGLGLGINVARLHAAIQFATIEGNRFELGRSLSTGVAVFSRSNYGDTSYAESGNYAGQVSPFGGAYSYVDDPGAEPIETLGINRHEYIHTLQAIDKASIGNGITGWNPSISGITLYGLGDVIGRGIMDTSLYYGHGLAHNNHYGGVDYYESDADWREREAYGLSDN